MTVDEFLQRLEGVKREKAGQWAARCPAHEDGSPSLAVKDGGDKILVHCLAGCTLESVLKALHLDEKALFAEKAERDAKPQIAATYPYHDERGELLFEVVRMVPKSFRQRRPFQDGWIWALGEKTAAELRTLGFQTGEGVSAVRRVLYRLTELVAADAKNRRVFIVEGEKDVDSLRALGFVATCCAGGSNAWHHVAAHAAEVLKGRHVTVIPDNDAPGLKYATEVITSLRGAAANIRMLQLPGLADKGDVSDWIRDGGTAAALQQLAKAAPEDAKPELAGLDYGTFSQRLDGEAAERAAQALRLIPYEVPFLDDQLAGMLPNDLVVLTARSGAGKTQMATMVGESAARAGRRALVVALEAEPREIERRIKYRALARFFEENVAPLLRQRREPAVNLSYRDWKLGRLDHLLRDIEEPTTKWLRTQVGDRLRTVYRGAEFGLAELERLMLATKDENDVFVIDHLHFIDTDDEKTENGAITEIMKRVRELALRMSKPVLLVAHLRKADRYRPTLMPSIDDIQGTGNVTKVATAVIAMAPAEATGDWWMAPTYMRVLKDRLDGDQHLVARVLYDRRAGIYSNTYELGRIQRNEKGAEEWARLSDDKLPGWAVRASGQRRLSSVG